MYLVGRGKMRTQREVFCVRASRVPTGSLRKRSSQKEEEGGKEKIKKRKQNGFGLYDEAIFLLLCKKCFCCFYIIFEPEECEGTNVSEFVERNHAFFVRNFINYSPCNGGHIIFM